ncbi:MAG: septum formation protein Maf [Rhodospirillales bacterium]|jgi:septum formation protein|nr:septum formation protein Maf [Rhodospirillales bacterium]
MSTQEIVLASASATRKRMLESAGLHVEIDPARVDEDEIKLSLKAEQVPVERAAEALAELKALRISLRRPGALVIGADQMLECDGDWFDKSPDRAAAREQLLRLRGRTHRLISAAVVAVDGQRLWHTTEAARLTMRNFSDAFLDEYLDTVGEAAFTSVGGYQLEGRGVQLFHRIEGDFFTILGLPLLPLLDFLRARGALAA